MKLITGGFEINLYCYCCTSCEERFYIEELVDNSRYDVLCPHCGSAEDVAISSEHLKEINA
ncbi:hypothetical protein AB0Y20_00910 [Heyndrickxia oleronia]|uniref:hypothetical protein n=1 Tax=Heyndrickxia oleronia TaxID=38875 RepID=UPI003F2227F6